MIFSNQFNPTWLEVTAPDDAVKIELRTSCTTTALLDIIYANVYDYCFAAGTIEVRNPMEDLYRLSNYGYQNIPTYLDIPILTVETADGRSLCVDNYQLGTTACGASPFTINPVGANYGYGVTCS